MGDSIVCLRCRKPGVVCVESLITAGVVVRVFCCGAGRFEWTVVEDDAAAPYRVGYPPEIRVTE